MPCVRTPVLLQTATGRVMDDVEKNDEPDARVRMRHKVGAMVSEAQAL